MRRGPAIVVLLALLAAFGYGAQRATVEGWQRLTRFAPAHFQASRPGAGPSPLVHRLVLISVEGLSPADAALLPSLDWLRARGAGFSLTVPGPAHPTPALATLLTGAVPQHHGVVLNTAARPLQADTLLEAARRAGLTTGGAGGPLPALMAETGLERWVTVADSGQLLQAARSFLDPFGPKLVLLHLDMLHTGAHQAGSARRESPDYRNLLGALDADLVQLLGLIDLKKTAVVIVGSTPMAPDLSHRPDGKVPLILAGAGIRSGTRGEAALIDVAPTVSVLAGTPTPLQATGRPLFEALAVEGRPADVASQRNLMARKLFADTTMRALGALAPTPEPPESAAGAAEYIELLDQRLREVRFEHWKIALQERAPYVGGAALLLLLYLLLALRQPFGPAVLGGILTYNVIFQLCFFATGGRYSAAMAGLEGLQPTLAAGLGLRTAAAMAFASAVTGLLLSRRDFKRSAYLTASSLHMVLSTAGLAALPVVIAVGLLGWNFHTELPAAGLWVWFFSTGLQIVVICYMSPIWALVAVGCQRAGRRLWPLREVGNPELNADKVVRLRSLRRTAEARRART